MSIKSFARLNPFKLPKNKIFSAAIGIVMALGGMYFMQNSFAATDTFALGTVQPTAGPQDCPIGSDCQGLEVSCPGVNRSRIAYLSSYSPSSAPRGVVVFFSASGGNNWYFGGQTLDNLRSNLQSDGFQVVQVRWDSNWMRAGRRESPGIAKLACRPATVINWIHQAMYKPMNVKPANVGSCGFCVTGNSGGATQVSYAIGYYGLDAIIDAVIPTAGPPHAAITKGCMRVEGYAYDNNNYRNIDGTYGYSTRQTGPCELADISFSNRWDEDSVSVGANDYYHPYTRVHLLVGGEDFTGVQAHSSDYYERLVQAGTPFVERDVIPGVGHGFANDQAGADALRTAILVDTGIVVSSQESPQPVSPTNPNPTNPNPTIPNPETSNPSAPVGVQYRVVGTRRVDMRWSENSPSENIVKYIVERNGSILADDITVTNHSDRSISQGATYTYSIYAEDNNGNVSTPTSFTVTIGQ